MPFSHQFRPIPLSQIRVRDPFWSERLRALSEVTIPTQYHQIAHATSRLANFRRAAGKEPGTHEGGYYFDDSDVYKWIEAASYAQAMHPFASNEPLIEEVVETVMAAQEPSGYLDTFFQLKHPDLKWRNLSAMHEMYCAGHLIEAAVARFETSGETDLLECARRLADHIASIFGPGKRRGYCGHQEIELALWRLHDVTGEQAYAELSCFFINERGQPDSPFAYEATDPDALRLSQYIARNVDSEGNYVGGDYYQDHLPVREQTEVVGHAVRAMYMMAAATEQAARTADEGLAQASLRLWENLTERRMYVTGGIGPSGHNEGFTFDFDLPNLNSYAETCAAVGLAMWGRRLSSATGEAQFADVMERAIFNGALSGISLSGDGYFYANPLESRGGHARVAWFGCACCPPNIARMIGSITDYAYAASEDALTVQFPVGGTLDVPLGGVQVKVEAQSEYPWMGRYTLRLGLERPAQFALRLRIPEWCDDMTVDIAGVEVEGAFDSGYAVYDRTWNDGDAVAVDMEMEPTWVQASPKVLENAGRTALTRGPLVYCAEEVDLGFPPQLLAVDPEAGVRIEPCELGTACVVEGGYRTDGPDGGLYTRWEGHEPRHTTSLRFIPYFAWANRGKGHMEVWLREL